MNNDTVELSGRYYGAEITCWLLSALLIAARFLGLSANQPLPLLNIQIVHQQYFVPSLFILLVAAIVYVSFEWKSSTTGARQQSTNRMRLTFTVMFCAFAFWLSYPQITNNTAIANVSPMWFLPFAVSGYFMGVFAGMIISSFLAIRSRLTSLNSGLPRIPLLSRALITTSLIALVVLISGIYTVWLYTPYDAKLTCAYILAIAFVIEMIRCLVPWLHHCGTNAKSTRFHQRLTWPSYIDDVLDYAHLLDERRGDIRKSFPVERTSPQDEIRRSIVSTLEKEITYKGQLLEDLTLTLVVKDGDETNQNPDNFIIRITTGGFDKKSLAVRVLPSDPLYPPQDIAISTTLVEEKANEYLVKNPLSVGVDLQPILTHALDEALIQTIKDKCIDSKAPVLSYAAMAGKHQEIIDLMQAGCDVNAVGPFGWTALLSATAQGFVEIMETLLEAGANPDIPNVHRITCLMYAARYGNIQAAKLLIDHKSHLNLQDIYGDSALMVAIKNKHSDVAHLLIDAGTDTTIRNRNNQNALDLSHKYGLGEIAKRLRGLKQ